MAIRCDQTETIDEAVRELAAARDEARRSAPLFSLETLRGWRELEEEIELKLEDIEHRLNDDGELANQIAFARAQELTRAVQHLLHRHARPQVSAVMTAQVRACRPEDSLERAAQILWEADCGAVPVVEARGQLVGLITDRDICMAAYIQGKPLRASSVASAMSRKVHVCSADSSIANVLELMAEKKVRRVPVVDPRGQLTGIVSLADVARYVHALPGAHPLRALLIPALAAISQPRPTRAPAASAAE